MSEKGKMLKCDFHIHTDEDPVDVILHGFHRIIDMAAKQNFDVISITNHRLLTCNAEYEQYAASRGIVLMPGIEAAIENRHIVILNADKDVEKIGNFSDLESYRKSKPDIFVLAPHPYYPRKTCLGKDLERHIDLFDGIEFCHFYFSFFNRFNQKAIEMAEKHGKSIVACSDTHHVKQFGRTYTLLESEKNSASILKNLKEGKTTISSSPLSPLACIRILKSVIYKKGKRPMIDEKLD